MAGPATGTARSAEGVPTIDEQIGVRVGKVNFGEGTVITKEQYLPNGAIYFEGYLSESLTVVGASDTTSALLPAGTAQCIVSTKVTTTLAGNSVANFDIGVTGSATLFMSNTTGITDGDTCVGSAFLTPALNAAAVGILITPDQVTTSGAMQIVAWFNGVRASTS